MLRSALSPALSPSFNFESLRLLGSSLDCSSLSLLHSPQLALFSSFTFCVTMANLFFGQMSFSICKGTEVGMPLLAWAAMQAGNLFLLADACQKLQDQVSFICTTHF